MKKLILALAGLVALGLVPAHAADANGTIVLPTAGTARLQRCSDVHNAPNGAFGWKLNVAAGKNFTLNAVGGDDVNDLDIAFYKTMTPCSADADPVAEATDHTNVEGNEAGKVPPDATVAIITLYVGTPNTAFVYNES